MESAVFSAQRWDRRDNEDVIESATPCHRVQVVEPYRASSPVCLTVQAAKPEDYAIASQHLLTLNTIVTLAVTE